MADGYIGRGPVGSIVDILQQVLINDTVKYKGLWAAETSYAINDLVYVPPVSMYIVTEAHTSSQTFSENYDKCDPYTVRFTVGQEHNAALRYFPGETVIFNENLYVCIEPTPDPAIVATTELAATNTTYWTLVVSSFGRQPASNVNITGGTIAADLLSAVAVGSDLIPSTTELYNLGSPTKKWKDLYLAGNTLYLGDASIKSDGSSVTITTADGAELSVSSAGISGTSEIQIQTNIISTTTADTNLQIQTVGNGKIQLSANTEVIGDLSVTGDISLQGNITIGNQTLDTITVVADFTSNLIPDSSDTYDLGTSLKRWRDVYSKSINLTNDITVGGDISVTGNITSNLIPDADITRNLGSSSFKFNGGYFSSVTTANVLSSADLTVTVGASNTVKINSTNALLLPVGTEVNKTDFTAETGQIRYNTTSQQFEGYQGVAWASLGGVRSVDGGTYISPELTPNASDDTLRFVTDSVVRMSLTTGSLDLDSSVAIVNIASTQGAIDTTSGALQIAGGVGIEENVYIGGSLTVLGDFTIGTSVGAGVNIATNVTIDGDLTVNGTTTTINSTTLTVDDKNIELGATATPTDQSADGGGITLFGDTNKTLTWVAATSSWTSSEHIDITAGKNFKIDATNVLTATDVFPTQATVNLASNSTDVTIGGSTGTATIQNENVNLDGTLNVAVDVKVNTDKFVILGTTGNTTIEGTLTVNGAIDFNSTFTTTELITASNGLLVQGSTTLNEKLFKVNDGTTDKFTVESSTGNTGISGTLSVTGTAGFSVINVSTGSFSGQLTSTLAIGTAPLVVTSTTKVDNLNADLLDGYNSSVSDVADTVVVRSADKKIAFTTAGVSGFLSGETVIQALSNASGTLTLPSTTDTLVGKDTTDTFTNKTLDLSSNTLTGTVAEFNAALSDDNFVTLTGTETLTNKTVNLTNNTVTGTTAQFNAALSDNDFATIAGVEALTNKTLNLNTTTLSGTTAEFNAALSDNDFATIAGVEALTNKTINLIDNTLTGTIAQFNSALSDENFATLAGTETLTNKTVALAENSLSGSIVEFNAALTDADFATLSGIETLTAKSISLTANTVTGSLAEFNTALTDAEFATLAGEETLTNKTVNLSNNTLSGTLVQFNTALADAEFTTLDGIETLTNKTLTNPTINAAEGLLVLPSDVVPAQTASGSIIWDSDEFLLTIGTGTGRKTLVDLDSSQVLTNKTLTSPVITGVSPTITLDGDLSGSVTLTDLGSGTLTATIVANSVELGTDTTGDYVESLIQGTGVTITAGSGEKSTPTIAIGQPVETTSNVIFNSAQIGNIDITLSTVSSTNGDLTLNSATGSTIVDDNLTITGNLIVQGSTVTVDSTVTTIVDPIIELGGEIIPGPTIDAVAVTYTLVPLAIIDPTLLVVDPVSSPSIITVTTDWVVQGAGIVEFANVTAIIGINTDGNYVVQIDQPATVIGETYNLIGPTAGVNDGKDRGVRFNWSTGNFARSGFFGFDDSTGFFTFRPKATFNGEVVTGPLGDMQANIFRGNLISDTTTVSTGLTVVGDALIQPGAGKTLSINPVATGNIDNTAIGVTVRSTSAFTALTANAAVTFTSETESVDPITGALVVSGGTGIGGNTYIGGNLNVDGLLSVGGNILFGGALTVSNGGTGNATFTTKGILYGNGIDPIQVTAASSLATNVRTGYAILTTNIDEVPVWTNELDGGAF